jgi:hypothetical protein
MDLYRNSIPTDKFGHQLFSYYCCFYVRYSICQGISGATIKNISVEGQKSYQKLTKHELDVA